MHPVVNHLVQLQELIQVRAEQGAAGHSAHMEQLDASIAAMTRQLPKEVNAVAQKLIKKDSHIVVPIAQGGCPNCRLTFPVSMIQAVRAGEELHRCPTCALFLYYPDVVGQHTGAKRRRSEPQKSGVARFSAASLMIPSLSGKTASDVIAELATRMHDEGFVDNAAKLVEAALRRETVMSTAVDHGLAFPHVRGIEGGGLTMALGIHKKGFKFGENDRRLTRIIFFMVIPTAASAFYLKLLSGLTQSLRKAETRDALVKAKTQEDLWKAVLKATRTTVK